MKGYNIFLGVSLWVLLLNFLPGFSMKSRKKTYSLLAPHTDSIVHHERLLPSDIEVFSRHEDSILSALQILQHTDTSLPYMQKLAAVKSALWHLRAALMKVNSFAYDFNKLRNNISLVYPRDSSFRIFTWQYSIEDLVALKQGLIQMNTKDGSYKIYYLVDKTNQIQNLLDTMTTAQAWIGAMYYYIHSQDIGRSRIYTLLGIDEHNVLSTRKWIEILRFSKDGTPYFGGPFFSWSQKLKPSSNSSKIQSVKPTAKAKLKSKSKYSKGKNKKQDLDLIPIPQLSQSYVPVQANYQRPIIHKRFMLEYMKSTVANLRYDHDLQMIIFDHLRPGEEITAERKYTYDIDGDYEGFVWQKDKWVHIANVFDFQLEGGKAPRVRPLNFRKQMKEYEKIMRSK